MACQGLSKETLNEITLVKIGGSVITEKRNPFTALNEVIDRLSSEICSARKLSRSKIILGNGGGSFPHVFAEKFQVQKGIVGGGGSKGFSLVQNSAANLNRIVVDSLICHGEDAVSISPSSCVMAESSRVRSWDMEIIKKMLAINLLPVIYGDVVIDIKQGFSIVSTEELLFYLAKSLNVKRVIIGTNVDGVIDYSTNKKYDIITSSDRPWVMNFVKGSNAVDVTGGMKSKVDVLLRLAEDKGVESEIINAMKPGFLECAIKGQKGLGTIIRNA